MSIPQSQLAPWTRKHDKPGVPLIPQAPVIVFPQSLEDLIQICSTRPPGQRLRGGSHWALSTAAVSDHVFIETHDFHEVFPGFPAFPRWGARFLKSCPAAFPTSSLSSSTFSLSGLARQEL